MPVRTTGRVTVRYVCRTALGFAALTLVASGWSDSVPSTTNAASDASTSQFTTDDSTSTFWLANVDSDRGADLSIELVREDGSPTSPLTWPGLAPFASTRLSLGAEPTVSGGRHAATVRSSGGRLGLVTYADGPRWGVAAGNAVEAASTDLVLGYWTRNFYGQSGHVTLFNPGAAAADDIEIEWHKDLDPGAPVVTTRLALAPGAVRTIDLAAPDAGVDVGDNARGWARVRSSVPLAVDGSLAPSDELAISAAVEAVPAVAAAKRWHVPLVYWNWWDGVSMYIESMTFVVNPGNAAVQVTQTLHGLTDDCRGVQKVDVPYDIPAQGAIMLAARPLPGRCAGSARIDATGDVIVTGLVNDGEHRTVGLYAPQPLADAAAHAVLPARRAVGPAQWTTEFHVLNPGPAAVNAALTLRKADGTIVPCEAACTFAAPSDGVARFDLAAMSDVPDGFDGSVWIDGDGPLHAVAYERSAAGPADGAVFRAANAAPRAGDSGALIVPRVVRAVPPTPTATSSPTPTATATEPPTETPTVTPPPSITPTPRPTITPMPFASSTILPHPAGRVPLGLDMTMDAVGLIGSYAGERARISVDPDGRGVILWMDGQLSLYDLEPDGPVLRGSLTLSRNLVYDRWIVRSGARAALIDGAHVTFLDLTRRDAPRIVRTDELGAPIEQFDLEGDRLYLGTRGNAASAAKVWTYAYPSPTSAQRIGEAVLEGRLVGLAASSTRIAASIAMTQSRTSRLEHPHLRLYDASDPSALRLIARSAVDVPPVIDFEGDRLLVQSSWTQLDTESFMEPLGVCLMDVTLLPAVPWRPCWLSRYVRWARFDGSDILVAVAGEESYKSAPMGITRLRTEGTTIIEPVDSMSVPASFTAAFAGGTICFEGPAAMRRGEDGFWCRDATARLMYVPSLEGEPEREPETSDDAVVRAFRLGGVDHALTAAYAHPLDTTTEGTLRAVGRVPLPAVDLAGAHFVEVAGRTWVRDATSAVAILRLQSDTLALEPTGFTADRIFVVGGDVVLVAFGFPTLVTVVDGTTLAERGRAALAVRTRPSEPILDGSLLYALATPRSWAEVDLTDPAQPRLARMLPDFAPRGFVAVDGVAFAPERSAGTDARSDGIALFDLRTAVPSRIGDIDLAGVVSTRTPTIVNGLFVATNVLYVDVGGGWAARIDVRDARAPRPIAAQLFPDGALRFDRLGEQLAVISGGWLTLLIPSALQDDARATAWRPWRRRPWAPFEVADDLLIVDKADPWVYDVRNAAQPRRTGALVGAIAHGLAVADGLIAARVYGGAGIRYWELTSANAPVLVGEWCLDEGGCSAAAGGEVIGALAAAAATTFAVTNHGLLLVLDTSDPTNVRRIAAVRAEPVDAYRLALIGSRLFVFQANGQAPFQFDVADARRPRPIGPMHGLPVTSHHGLIGSATLVLADGRSVLFVDASDRDDPRVTDALWFGDTVRGLAVTGSQAVVLAEGSIWTIDVQAGRPPSVFGKMSVGATWSEDRIAARGDVVYYGNTWRRGIEVLGNRRVVGGLHTLMLPMAWRSSR